MQTVDLAERKSGKLLRKLICSLRLTEEDVGQDLS